jgi:cell wall-associated NlpC family hydrolase
VPVAVAVAALVVGLLGVAPATAEPYPTQDQVDAAKAAVTTTAQQVAALESRLAAANAELSRTQIAAAQAGEDWNEAQVVLEEATAAAASAAAAAEQARADLVVARSQIGSLAADAYRAGGSFGSLEAVLGGEGPQDLVDRAGTLRYLGNGRQQVFQRGQAAQLVSQLMDEQARTAEKAQQDAAAAAEEAKQAAEAADAAAQAQVAATASEKAEVVTQLAALRSTSVALEQERQVGLEAERIAREEAAARAAQERRERAEREAADRAAADRDAADRAARDRAARDAADRASRDRPTAAPAPAAPSRPTTPPRPDPAPPSAPPPGDSSGSSSGGQAAVEWARTQIGKPYLWGGTGPDAYDCSGLTGAAWRHGGVNLPRTSRSQYTAVQKIAYSDLRPGDLVFYGEGSSAGSIYHVAIYSGGGRMIEAPRAGIPVRETSLRMSGAMPYAGRP